MGNEVAQFAYGFMLEWQLYPKSKTPLHLDGGLKQIFFKFIMSEVRGRSQFTFTIGGRWMVIKM